MKRLSLLLFFLLTIFTLSAQDGISIFIGRANRYADVELSDYRKRLCVEYGVSNRLLDNYYRLCGRDWGNVGIALEISKSSGRKMHDVCNYYKRYRRYGWDRVLVEIGLRPGSAHYHHFMTGFIITVTVGIIIIIRTVSVMTGITINLISIINIINIISTIISIIVIMMTMMTTTTMIE